MSYKELDGAVPGSKDILDFEYISDQPSIAVETWGGYGALAGSGEGAQNTSEKTSVEGVAALNGYGDYNTLSDDPCLRQRELVEAVETSASEHPDALSGTAETDQQAGGWEAATGAGSDSDMAEYLKSQQIFSYDSPSTPVEDAKMDGGDGNSYGVDQASNQAADESNTSPIGNTGSYTKANSGSTGEGGQAQAVENEVQSVPRDRAVNLGVESWGWALPNATVSEEVGSPADDGEFEVGGIDYEGMGVAEDRNANIVDGYVELRRGKGVKFPEAEEGTQELLTADVGEYDPSTPSYGLDEQFY